MEACNPKIRNHLGPEKYFRPIHVKVAHERGAPRKLANNGVFMK